MRSASSQPQGNDFGFTVAVEVAHQRHRKPVEPYVGRSIVFLFDLKGARCHVGSTFCFFVDDVCGPVVLANLDDKDSYFFHSVACYSILYVHFRVAAVWSRSEGNEIAAFHRRSLRAGVQLRNNAPGVIVAGDFVIKNDILFYGFKRSCGNRIVYKNESTLRRSKCRKEADACNQEQYPPCSPHRRSCRLAQVFPVQAVLFVYIRNIHIIAFICFVRDMAMPSPPFSEPVAAASAEALSPDRRLL